MHVVHVCANGISRNVPTLQSWLWLAFPCACECITDISGTPHFDGAVLRRRVDETGATPAHTRHSSLVTGQSQQCRAEHHIPQLHRRILHNTQSWTWTTICMSNRRKDGQNASLAIANESSLTTFLNSYTQLCLQCFDAVGWAAGRASGL